jgi:hypothetical protein
VKDVEGMKRVLEEHEEDGGNFETMVLRSDREAVTKALLWNHISQLFEDGADVALLYFSGHGTVVERGAFLVTQDLKEHNEGVSMAEVLAVANASTVKECFIILDCCHAGKFGGLPELKGDVIRDGISILCSSRPNQSSMGGIKGNASLFTSLLIEGLEGRAADLLGSVTLASLYANVDSLLGLWGQQPVFKCNVRRMTPLRRCKPRIEVEVLKRLPEYFDSPSVEFPLDPSFDPELEPRHPKNEAIMADLRQYLACGLLVPVGERYLYHAAKHSKSCRLTPLGGHYWDLARRGRLR